MIDLVPLETVERDAVEALLDRAFGHDRHRRTAYRIRGAARAIPTLSFGAIDDGVLIGSIQCWPVTLIDAAGARFALVMLGPVAVEPDRQRDGTGRRLVAVTMDAAMRVGLDDAMMLIGDPDYYGRFFGFSAKDTADWRVPGPVERHRLLARGANVPATAGMLGPREPVVA